MELACQMFINLYVYYNMLVSWLIQDLGFPNIRKKRPELLRDASIIFESEV